MDIRRKNITNEKLAEKEAALAESVKAIKEEYDAKLHTLGYELELELLKSDEDDDDETEMDFNAADYKTGYISSAYFVIKRPKVEKDIESEEKEAEELEHEAEQLGAVESEANGEMMEEEKEQAENDKTLKRSEEELRRTVAFTRIMLVRIYKSFWIENVSICDSTDTLRADLDDIYDKLSKGEE